MTERKTRLLLGEKETRAFGVAYAKHLLPGDILLLTGNLGSGKTTFTKGLARGLGITRDVVSPTFLLRKRYLVKRKHTGITGLNHLDAYRFDAAGELRGVLDEWPDATVADVWVIEWGKKIRHLFPVASRVHQLVFSIPNPRTRRVTVTVSRRRRIK